MAAHVIIKRQQIHIRTPDPGLAFQIRKQLTDSLQFELIEMLDQIFARYKIPDNTYINIDKLSVDLGSVSVKDFEKHFLEFVEPKLIHALQENLEYNLMASQGYAQNQQQSYRYDPHEPEQISGGEQQELNALLYFLSFGSYPWWYKKEIRKTPAWLLDNLSEHARETLILRIFSIKKRDGNEEADQMIRRLFIHLPGERHPEMINRLLGLYNDRALTDNIDVLEKNKTGLRQSLSLSETEFYTRLFSFLLKENIPDEKNIIFKFLSKVKEENASKIIDAATKKNNKSQEKKIREAEAEGIYIDNAGLVLLHPFLPALFESLGLLDQQKRFHSADAGQKAAVLLYYLQCGDEQYQEWGMVLNKIFCGIGSAEIIPEGIIISDKEKEECRSLLQTVVNYWEALKGSSIESLQNTFILREGKISRTEDHWLIQIERTGVDILLERLPWGYGTIKFPWLDHIIYTEW